MRKVENNQEACMVEYDEDPYLLQTLSLYWGVCLELQCAFREELYLLRYVPIIYQCMLQDSAKCVARNGTGPKDWVSGPSETITLGRTQSI